MTTNEEDATERDATPWRDKTAVVTVHTTDPGSTGPNVGDLSGLPPMILGVRPAVYPMTTVEAIQLAVETLDRLAWDCDLTDHNEAGRLWNAVELLVDLVEGRGHPGA